MTTNATVPQVFELSDDHMIVFDLCLKLDDYRERLTAVPKERRDLHLSVEYWALERLLRMSFLDAEALARDIARSGVIVPVEVLISAIGVIDAYNNGEFHRLGRTG